MSGASKQRGRQERIESLGIQKPRFVQWWQNSDKAGVITRIGMALIAAILLLVCCQTWRPRFAYRLNSIPSRDLVSRVTFEVLDEEETRNKRQEARQNQALFYSNHHKPLDELKSVLRTSLLQLLLADSYQEMEDEDRTTFAEFYEGITEVEPEDSETPALTPEQRFAILKSVLKDDVELKTIDEAYNKALNDGYKTGLIKTLTHDESEGIQTKIRVFPVGAPEKAALIAFSDVQIGQTLATKIKTSIKEDFRKLRNEDESKDEEELQIAADMIADWIVGKLPDHETLEYDRELSDEFRQQEADKVKPVMKSYRSGDATLAEAGKPLAENELALLRSEWDSLVSNMHLTDKLARVAAFGGMIAALYLLCSTYIFFVDDRSLIFDRQRLVKLLAIMVIAVSLGYAASQDQWRGELIPLVLASIICAVVYGRELALLLMAAASVSLTLFLGADLSELVVMAAACTSCILLLGRIRSRTHLFFVGTTSAAITILTVIGVGIVTAQSLSAGTLTGEMEQNYNGPVFDMVLWELMRDAFWSGFCILVSASVMTPMLPFVEKVFGVQTDLSLLELGDASHPLLRRLAQRAPGTYNHSINVASIAEAAADEIGANGLLVRVGAYFHDIGKMFKPEYFVENQSAGVNQHDTLQPAMSTLVIIAHVKDGADLARSHHLPEPIIDFILQHHGTTLVEYFYREAARRSEEDPNAESVSDKDFRYPGPKPQTLEAAVMMLADTVESASRTLVDPTPSRIQNLVDSIAEKKMSDGQFDDCGLTFKQLARIRHSLVKSLTAIYHARVKYPGQQSA